MTASALLCHEKHPTKLTMKREDQTAALSGHKIVEHGRLLRVRLDQNLDNFLLSRRDIQMVERREIPLNVANVLDVECHYASSDTVRKKDKR